MNRKWIALIVVVVLVAAGIYFLGSNLNSLVARTIETNGSKVTRTSVGVSGVKIEIREGRSSIENLAVASPGGYEAREAFSLGNITVDVDVKSVTGDPIVIDEVRISAPVVYAEFTRTGVSNIDELRKQVQEYTGGGSGGGDGSKGDAKRIRISSFVFEKGRIEVDASALGVEKRTVDLPEIRLTNVGGTSGAAPDEIAKEILTAFARKATSEVASSEINRLIKKQLGDESIGDKAKGLIDKIKK